MTDDEQTPSTSVPWHAANIRESLLAAVQRAGSQEIPNEIVEDFRAALDILTQAAPSSANTAPFTANRIVRVPPDTVIVVEEESVSNDPSNSSTRHRLTPNNLLTNDAERIGTIEDAMDAENTDGVPADENAANANLQRELGRLRGLAQNRDLQRAWAFLLNVLPFLVILIFKIFVDSFSSLLILLIASLSFHFANNALLGSLRERKYLCLLQSNMFVTFYFGMQFLLFGWNTILLPMRFVTLVSAPVSFSSTLHVVITTDLAVKIITVQIKGLIAAVPSYLLTSKRQRRIFQWIEYTSQMYRYVLPVPQWTRYISYSDSTFAVVYYGDRILAVLYILYKTCLFQIIARRWLESTRYVFRLANVGTVPSRAEVDYVRQCTICFGDFDSPVKLSCGHIFCDECIATWLDKEHTCPMCRATVAQEDNTWKSGRTTYSPQIC